MNVKHSERLYKTDRLNYIVNRMRMDQDITPAKLAEELNVSERTVYRDLRNLESGQALKKRYSRREGRYLLENELALPPITFTPSEALAIYSAAANPALLDGNFFAADLRSGLNKIGQAIAPESNRENGTDTNEGTGNLSIAPFSMSHEYLQRPLVELARRAMLSNRKLRIHYWSASLDQEQVLVIAPLDVRHVEGLAYLLANSDGMSGTRLFKLSRIRTAEMTSDRFRFPRRFMADTFFERAWKQYNGSDPEVVVKIRFHATIASHVVDCRGQQFISMETLPDGALICTARVNTIRELAWWVLAYGSQAEVLSPTEMRAEFVRIAREMVAIYALVRDSS